MLLDALRARLVDDLGLPFPGVRLVRDTQLEPGAYSILVYDVAVADGMAVPGKDLVVIEPGAALPAGADEDARLAWLGRAPGSPRVLRRREGRLIFHQGVGESIRMPCSSSIYTRSSPRVRRSFSAFRMRSGYCRGRKASWEIW